MTVKELIAALQKMPEDTEVFAYNESTEDDSSVDKVVFVEDAINNEHYGCQGDSVAADYALSKNKKSIVAIIGGFAFYDCL